MNYEQIQAAKELARQKVINIAAITAFPAMQIQYVGPKLFAKITVAAGGDITIYADDVDGATTSYYTADLSTPAAGRDTYGELAAEINADPYLRCFLIGVLPSNLTDDTLAAVSGGDIRTTNGLTLYMDAAVVLATAKYTCGFAVTNQKFESRPSNGWATKQAGWRKDDYAINTLSYAEITGTQATTTDGIQIYAVDDVAGTSSQLLTDTFTSATKKTLGSTPTPEAPYVSAPRGQRLCVQFRSITNAMSAAVAYAIGYTKDFKDPAVPGANYTGCV